MIHIFRLFCSVPCTPFWFILPVTHRLQCVHTLLSFAWGLLMNIINTLKEDNNLWELFIRKAQLKNSNLGKQVLKFLIGKGDLRLF